MINIIKAFVVGLLIGALVTTGVFLYHNRPRPGPVKPPAEIVINPTPKEAKQADATATIKHHIKIKQSQQPADTTPGKVIVPATATATVEGQGTPIKDVPVTVVRGENGDLGITIETPIAVNVPEKHWAVGGGMNTSGEWIGRVEYERKLIGSVCVRGEVERNFSRGYTGRVLAVYKF